MSLDVSTERTGAVLRVRLAGELDAETAPSVTKAVTAAGEGQPPARTVIIDATELTFMDSSGVSELLRVHQSVTAESGAFGIEGAHGTVRRVLEITGLIEFLGVT